MESNPGNIWEESSVSLKEPCRCLLAVLSLQGRMKSKVDVTRKDVRAVSDGESGQGRGQVFLHPS